MQKCPKCGKRSLKRLIGTGSAVLFKGSGFYETDYRSDSYKKSAKADKPDSKSTDSKNASTGSPSNAKSNEKAAKSTKKSKDAPADSH